MPDNAATARLTATASAPEALKRQKPLGAYVKPSVLPPLMTLIVAALSLALLASYVMWLDNWREPAGYLIGRDFVNIHLSGRLIASGDIALLFDRDAYDAELKQWLGADYSPHFWSYPPLAFPVAELLGRLPYFVALLVWSLGGSITLFFAARAAGLSGAWALALVLSPASVLCLLAGQNGTFIAAFVLFASAAATKGWPVLGGISWALAAVKPHLGLLALPMLLGRRDYRVIGAGAASLGAVIAATVWRYGLAPWEHYFTVTLKQQIWVIEVWYGALELFMPTFFMQGRLLGLGTGGAYGLHAAAAALAAILLVRAWPGRGGDLRHWLTWFTLGTFLLLPYSFLYDFVIYQAALAFWARSPEQLLAMRPGVAAGLIWSLAWSAPYLALLLVAGFGVQCLPILLLLLLWRLGSSAPKA